MLQAILVTNTGLAVQGRILPKRAEKATLAPNLQLNSDSFIKFFNEKAQPQTEKIKEINNNAKIISTLTPKQNNNISTKNIEIGKNLLNSFKLLNFLTQLPLWNFFSNPINRIQQNLIDLYEQNSITVREKINYYKAQVSRINNNRQAKKRIKLIQKDISRTWLQINYYEPLQHWFTAKRMPVTGRFIGQIFLPFLIGPLGNRIADAYKQRQSEKYSSKRTLTPFLEQLIYNPIENWFARKNRPIK